MAKKPKNPSEYQDLEIENELLSDEVDEEDSDDNSYVDLESHDSTPQPAKLADEPLFSALLRRSVAKLWPDDRVLNDFCQYIAVPLSAKLGHVAAKGGDFVLQRAADGKVVEERYAFDQSFRAHLINGGSTGIQGVDKTKRSNPSKSSQIR